MQVSRNVVSEPIRNANRGEFMESERYVRAQEVKKRDLGRKSQQAAKQWLHAAYREEQL